MPNWSGAAGGAATGYSTGSMFGGPVGGAIGAGIGGLFGLFKKKKPKPGASATGPSPDAYQNIMGQYQDFAKTGGYSPQDLANIRSRSVSPIRSIYQRGQAELSRNRALQGGYSPNYASAMTRMAREQSMNAADASTNVEAGIADLTQKGRLAGLTGMSNLYGTQKQYELGMQNAPSDYQRKLSSIKGTIGVGSDIAGGLAKIFG